MDLMRVTHPFARWISRSCNNVYEQEKANLIVGICPVCSGGRFNITIKEELTEYENNIFEPDVEIKNMSENDADFSQMVNNYHEDVKMTKRDFKAEKGNKMEFLAEKEKKHKIDKIITSEREKKNECICDICGKKQYSSASHEYHMKAVHGSYSERKYTCDHPGCSKAYLHSYQLETHKAKHKGGFICDHCGKSITTKIMLSYHIKLVHKKESLNAKCSHCDEVFRDYTAKRNHLLKVHNIGKCYKCGVCQMKFIDKTKQRRHELTHGQPAFECSHCGKRVSSQDILKAHIRLHTGELFGCPYCPWKGNTKDKLKRHKKTKHKQELEDELAQESLNASGVSV